MKYYNTNEDFVSGTEVDIKSNLVETVEADDYQYDMAENVAESLEKYFYFWILTPGKLL